MAEQIEISAADPKAAVVKEKIDALIVQISDGQWTLGRKFVQLGVALLEVRSNKYWETWGHASFGAFIDTVTAKLDRGRAQLYGYIQISERLLPSIGEDQLVEMGISKASELARVVSAGKVIPPALFAKAIDGDVKVSELKAAVGAELNQERPENGQWRDVGGFYATKEEWEEIQRGYDIAARVDPVIAGTTPDWARRKEIQQRLTREFLATYEQAVETGAM